MLKDANIELEKYVRNQKEVDARHAYMCAFFGLDKNDECHEKSEDFFKIFQGFFKQIEASLPKIERKKTVPGAKPG